MSNFSTFDVKPYTLNQKIGKKIWMMAGTGLDANSYLSGKVIKNGLVYPQADYPELFNIVGHGDTTSVFTARGSGTTSTINALTYGNGLYVYGAAAGTIGTSTNATTWTVAFSSQAQQSATTVDYSPTQKSITLNGSATLSTVQSKFGGYSLSLPGTSNSYIGAVSSADFSFGTGDFTIEYWIYLETSTTSGTFIDTRAFGDDTGGFSDYFSGTSNVYNIYIHPSTIYTSPSPISTAAWTHVAISRQSTSLRVFFNGIQQGSTVTNSTNFSSTNLLLGVNRASSGSTAVGTSFLTGAYVDDVRITKGVARYTANFAPPTALPDSPIGDPNYSSVSLLLKMDPSKLFADLSQNANTLTLNGNVRESASNYKSGTGSIYFDGYNDYVSVPNSTAFDFGTGDFTIEAWVYYTSFTNNDNDGGKVAVLCSTASGYIGNAWVVEATANAAGTQIQKVDFFNRRGGTNVSFSSGAIALALGTWHHVAVTRSGTTIYIFINGILANSGTFPGDPTVNSPEPLWIGRQNISGYNHDFNGYIDNLRITKGVARYTASFTPQDNYYKDDPYYANTVLIIDADNTLNSSTTFTDKSPLSQTTVTASGTTQISTTQSKFGGASAYIDGTVGGGLTATPSTAFAFGTQDFTVEFWIYKNASNGTMFFSGNAYNSATGIHIWTSGGIGIAVGGVNLIANAGSMPLSTWIHVAVTRESGTIRAFINGTSVASVVNTTNFTDGSCRIGMFSDGSDRVNAYFDEYRVTKGLARYTASFTAPTAPYPDSVAGGDPYFDNVVLLLHMDGANGSTTFTNSSSLSFNTPITASGSAKILTTVKKYGTGSVYLDGTTNTYLSFQNSTNFNFGTGDFTIEAWVYFDSVTAFRPVFSVDTSSYPPILIQVESGTLKAYATSASTSWDILNGATFGSVITGQWYHIALTRSGSTFKTFLDGITITTVNSSSAIENQNGTGRIGTSDFSSNLMSGYVDDLRVTKGVARYTANFTPPGPHYSGNDSFHSSTSLLVTGEYTDIISTITGPSTGITTQINCLTYGNGVYVCGAGGGGLASSTDATTTWTLRTSGTSSTINAMTYASGIYVYAGIGGVLATSTDAVTWTARTSGTTSTILSLFFANNLYVYAGSGGALATSTDAVTWTAITSGTASAIHALIYGNGTFVYAGVGGVLRTSTDAVTWTARTSGTTSTILALTYDSGLYSYAGSNGVLATSTDAITWTARTTGIVSSAINSLIYANGIYVYAGAGGILSTSTDLYNAANSTFYNYNSYFRVNSFTTTTIAFTSTVNGMASIVGYVAAKTPGLNFSGDLTYPSGSLLLDYSGSTPPSGYVQTGAAYNQSAYPQLYLQLGLINAYTWTARSSGTTNGLLSLTYGNGVYVTGGTAGTLRTSTDAVTWTARTSGTASSISAITYGNGIFIYGAGGGGLATSTDAITWTARTSGITSSINALIYNSGLFVGSCSNGIIIISTDGITWTAYQGSSGVTDNSSFLYTPIPPSFSVNGTAQISTTQSKFGGSSGDFTGAGSGARLAVAASDIFNFGAGDYTIEGWMYPVSFGTQGGFALFVNWDSGTTNPRLALVLASTGLGIDSGFGLGLTFTGTTTVSQNQWHHCALTKQGNIWRTFLNGTLVSTALGGRSWTGRSSGTTSTIQTIAYGNGTFVYAGVGGVLRTSTDGVTWTARTSGTTQNITEIIYGNGLYVYVGIGGVLATSTDGVTWTARTSGTTSTIAALTYGNGIYVYGGEGGMVATSTDAVTWTARTSGATLPIISLTYGNGLYVFGLTSGAIYTSTDAITWTQRDFSTNNYSVNSLTYGNGVYLAGRQGGYIARSIDGVIWTVYENLNVFTDSSTFKPFTAQGGASLSSTQFKFGSKSLFTGASGGGYLTTVSNSGFGFGTGDFTIECWIYPVGRSAAGYDGIIDFRTSGSATESKYTLMLSSTGITIQLGSINQIFNAGTINLNTWYHVAFVRASGVLKVFINGTQVGTDVSSSADVGSTSECVIGTIGDSRGNSSYNYRGYIDEVRITKGVARYTANFTAPTAAFPESVGAGDSNWSNVTLLMHYESGAGTYSTETSSSIESITYADGVFVYGTAGGGLATSTDGLTWSLATSGTSSTIYALTYGNGTLVYAGNGGVLATSATGHVPTNYPAYIGGYPNNYSNGYGYIDEVRITKGVARYTANFTAPTAPFPNSVGEGDANFANVIYLLHMDGTAGSTVFTNSVTTLGAPTNLSPSTVTLVGGSRITKDVKKYGNGSLFLRSGSADYLTIPSSTKFYINTPTTPFCIEAWVYPLASGGCIFSENYSGAGNTIAVALSLSSTTSADNTSGLIPILAYYTGSAWVTAAASNTAISLNTWTHVAAVFTGSTTKIFLNGTDVTTGTPATTWGVLANSGESWYVGRRWDTSSSPYFTGYIDDLRFTIGEARYTTNFAVPTTAFPNSVGEGDPHFSKVALLLHMDEQGGPYTGHTVTLNALTYGNGLYVYAGWGGALATSTDAITWTNRTAADGLVTGYNLTTLAYGNGVYVYGGASPALATSTDGITWTTRTSGTSSFIRSLIYGNDLFVFAGDGGVVATSTNAVTWTLRTSATTSSINALNYSNGLYVYVGNTGALGTSTDAVSPANASGYNAVTQFLVPEVTLGTSNHHKVWIKT